MRSKKTTQSTIAFHKKDCTAPIISPRTASPIMTFSLSERLVPSNSADWICIVWTEHGGAGQRRAYPAFDGYQHSSRCTAGLAFSGSSSAAFTAPVATSRPQMSLSAASWTRTSSNSRRPPPRRRHFHSWAQAAQDRSVTRPWGPAPWARPVSSPAARRSWPPPSRSPTRRPFRRSSWPPAALPPSAPSPLSHAPPPGASFPKTGEPPAPEPPRR